MFLRLASHFGGSPQPAGAVRLNLLSPELRASVDLPNVDQPTAPGTVSVTELSAAEEELEPAEEAEEYVDSSRSVGSYTSRTGASTSTSDYSEISREGLAPFLRERLELLRSRGEERRHMRSMFVLVLLVFENGFGSLVQVPQSLWGTSPLMYM